MSSKKIKRAGSGRKVSKLHISLIVAGIGLVGVIITAVFSYVSATAPIRLSIETTQTAAALPPVSTTVPQSLQGQTDLPTPHPTSDSDLASIVDFYTSWIPCTVNVAVVLPDSLQPTRDSVDSLERIRNADLSDQPVAPVGRPSLSRIVQITNTSTTVGEWLTVENRIVARLEIVSPTVEHVDLWNGFYGCGGGEYKEFPPVILDQQLNNLNQDVSSDEYDFFSLQPGERDYFVVDLICNAPGIYRANIALTVEYRDESLEIELLGDKLIMCPDTYTSWRTDLSIQGLSGVSPMEYLGDYYWNGTDYVVSP